MLNWGKLEFGGRSRLPALKGVRGCARSPEIRLGRGTIMISHEFASKTNHKRVSSHSKTPLGVGTSHEHLDSFDSPWFGLEGSHHLPPYSILCSSMLRLHSNGTFSRDSQGEIPKLSQVGFSGLWELIFLSSDLRLEWGLNQSCSSLWELSNTMSHSCCKRQEEVDSRLLVVGLQMSKWLMWGHFGHLHFKTFPMT
jgi:hypothetical protein